MTPLDWVIIVYVGLAALNGLKAGLVQMVGAIVGLFIGVILAAQWYESVGEALSQFVFANPLMAKVMAFTMIVLVVTRVVAIATLLLDRVVKFASIFPPIAAINRLGGLALGALEAILTAAAVIFFAEKFPINPQWPKLLDDSLLVPFLSGVGNYITPLLPAAEKQLQSILKATVLNEIR